MSNSFYKHKVIKPVNIKTMVYANPNNSTNIESPDYQESDIVEKYSNWLGLFGPEYKWKSVRYTIYGFAAGWCLADAGQQIADIFEGKPLEDYFSN
tara:strand:+ start:8326 stop:8613 length:288 start_codon:yes stop_codon:yes gene_type:complete